MFVLSIKVSIRKKSGNLFNDPRTYILNTFGSVGFYGLSTVIDYLMPIPVCIYILNIYDFVWLGFMAYQPS